MFLNKKIKLYNVLFQFREIDGIPLLLDCCNIDARNPRKCNWILLFFSFFFLLSFVFVRFSIDNFYAVILQWTILALRNLCEGNPENQEIIGNCEKTGVPNNPALQEMGLTLHEDADGQSIRIVPLRRN